MAIQIRSKGGKIIGKLSDDLDNEDYLVVNNKQVPLAEVYGNKELKDSFNDNVKKDNTTITDD